MHRTEYIKFPDNFLWGAAIASHQVEGNNTNNWSEWEKINAQRLAKESEKKFFQVSPVWEEIKEEATSPSNYISATACDHYNRFNEDFEIAKNLKLKALRISIEWSRIEPEEGNFNLDELNHYKKVFASLIKLDIKPVVTLWHWTFPLWVSKQGGWINRKTIKYFDNFVEKVVGFFPEIDFWVTLNEAEIFARESYLLGRWPANGHNPLRYMMVVNTIAAAHNKAYETIKKINKDACVGLTHNITYFEPNKNRFLNKVIAKIIAYIANSYFLNLTHKHSDYLGLNYYFHTTINIFNEPKIVCAKSDLGWELCEYGIYNVLKELGRYNKPIYITENGLADKNDTYREGFIKDTLVYVDKAIKEGVDVRGYLYWSLIDNFEWDKGFWPRFGLVEIDYKNNLKRTIRKSAFAYSDIIKHNGFMNTEY